MKLNADNLPMVLEALKGRLDANAQVDLWRTFECATREQFVDAIGADVRDLLGVEQPEPPVRAIERTHEAVKTAHRERTAAKRKAAAGPLS